MNPHGGTAILQPLLIAVIVGLVLFVLFFYAIRRGRLASRGARIAAAAIIAIIVILLWLAPGWFLIH